MLAVSHQTLQRDHDGRPRSILEFTTIPTSATETLALVPSLEYAGDRGYVLAPVRDPTGKLVDARVLFVSAEVGLVHPIMARRPEATMAELYPEFARTRLFAVIERVLATAALGSAELWVALGAFAVVMAAMLDHLVRTVVLPSRASH